MSEKPRCRTGAFYQRVGPKAPSNVAICSPFSAIVTDLAKFFFVPKPCDADDAMLGMCMIQPSKAKKPKPDLSVVGWLEYIALPDLGLHHIKAKFDTGARTSALHATQIETFMRDDQEWVRFNVQLEEDDGHVQREQPVYDRRQIKNTSGVPEERIVIRTPVVIAGRKWPIAVSLTDRSNMRLPMIVGRTALKKQNIAIHTRKTKLTSR